MNHEPMRNVSLNQNLKDAGCTTAMINRFWQLQAEEKTSEQINLLLTQRRSLLTTIHKKQKNLDCLDHLIFTIKKQITTRSTLL